MSLRFKSNGLKCFDHTPAAVDGGTRRRRTQMVKVPAIQEERQGGGKLTEFTMAWGCSRCPWLVKGRSRTSGIPRRSSCLCQAPLFVVVDEGMGHAKTNKLCSY